MNDTNIITVLCSALGLIISAFGIVLFNVGQTIFTKLDRIEQIQEKNSQDIAILSEKFNFLQSN